MKKFHPILFSTPMVQAILEGKKTMTRRTVKDVKYTINQSGTFNWELRKGGSFVAGGPNANKEDLNDSFFGLVGYCPFGKVGDVLWVRETTCQESVTDEAPFKIIYKADVGENYPMGSSKWKPSIFMPKEACRIFLEIADIKIERLHDISEEDAKAEGVSIAECCHAYYHGFSILWQKINGVRSWEANPFVWVISFKQIDKPENFL